MPKGYKDGVPVGGRRVGAGRKPTRGEKLVQIVGFVFPDTKTRIKAMCADTGKTVGEVFEAVWGRKV